MVANLREDTQHFFDESFQEIWGFRASTFMGFLVGILCLTFFVLGPHVMNLWMNSERFRPSTLSMIEIFFTPVGEDSPLYMSQMMVWAFSAYFVALAVGWIVFAESQGI